MTERWLPVVGFEGRYEVSDLGRVKSLARTEPYGRHDGDHVRVKREKILKASPSGDYLTVRLKGKTFFVHILVLTAFIGPKPEGECACHGPDFDGTNNKLTNLRWGSYKENNDERAPFSLLKAPNGRYLPTPESKREKKKAGA